MVHILGMPIEKMLRKRVTDRLAEFGGGARRFERSVGLKDWALRGFLDPDRKQSPSLQKAEEICEALGLGLYIGPLKNSADAFLDIETSSFSDTDTLPHLGLAKCGIVGWFNHQDSNPLPMPEGLNDPDAFYVQATGHSMRPEGINPGDLCLVSPAQRVAAGDRVWIEDGNGKVSIKRLVDEDSKFYHLRGWLDPEHRKQTSFNEQRVKALVKCIAPVIAVFAKQPVAGKLPDVVPDPRAEIVPSSETRAAGWRIADSASTVPLAGYAGAGGEIAFDGGFDPTEMAPAPPDGGESLAAVEVRGDSASPILREGDRVYFRPDHTANPRNHIGRLVVATTDEGAAYIKILRRGDAKGKWNLESINPRYRVMENVTLARIAPFVWVHFNGTNNGGFQRAD